MIDPNKELFKWGPIDGKPIYIDGFTYSFEIFPKHYNGTWPDLIGYFKDEKITFIGDNEDLYNEGENLFKKYILNESQLVREYKSWQEAARKIIDYQNKEYKDFSDKELTAVYQAFLHDILNFWLPGFLPELSNWGGERLLKNMILNQNKDNFVEIFEKMSAPEDLSFFQKEERELLEIIFIDDLKAKEQALINHQQNYYWLRNNYAETQILNLDFFKHELDQIDEQVARKKISKIDCYINEIKQSKSDIINKYQLPKDLVELAHKLSFSIWWQDLRKKYIFIINHILTQFLNETASRKNINFDDLTYYRQFEITDLLKHNQQIDVANRKKSYILYYHRQEGVSEMEGNQASQYILPYLEHKITDNAHQIKGVVVSRGHSNITGKVCLLFSPKDTSKMQNGDILVAPMTSPDFIVAMRKASAIITDEGGMTSHVAIVSRELGIPCIVATKIATKVLKDGDMVEVDTNEGKIRKMEEYE